MRGITKTEHSQAPNGAGGLRRSRLLAALTVLAFALLLTGCGALGGDQNTFAPEGEAGRKALNLFYLAMWPALVIMIGVFGAIIYMLVRFRRRSDDEPPPKQVHGNQRLELTWTILPAALLLGLAIPVIDGIIDLGRSPAEDALKVEVHAFQFNWQFAYPDYQDASGKPLTTEFPSGDEVPELHIPVDREVGVTLESADVIHSFWVPKLAGKLDIVPGRNNQMWFSAEKVGNFSAQCAEFCGVNHAFMRFRVVAQTPEDFQAWIDEQLAASNARAAAQK